MDLDVFAVIREPCPDLTVFVIGGVVLDEMDAAGNILAQNSFQIRDVGYGVEHLLELVEEPGGVQLDHAEDFEGVALARRGNFRLSADPGPGLVEGGILAEGRLVPKEESGPFAFGFFLMSGNR